MWNNPLNWTDPSGMSAIGYGTLGSKIALPLSLGNIARAAALLTATGTAAYLYSEADKNVLSVIGAGINCTMFTLARALQAKMVNPDANVSVVSGRCGVTITPNNPIPDIHPPIPLPPNDNDPDKFCKKKFEIPLPKIASYPVARKQCVYSCPNGELKEKIVSEHTTCQPASIPAWLNPYQNL